MNARPSRHLNPFVVAATFTKSAGKAVGRVGALAAALGVGSVLGGIGIAVAEPDAGTTQSSAAPSAGSSSATSNDTATRRQRGGVNRAPSSQAPRQPYRGRGAAATNQGLDSADVPDVQGRQAPSAAAPEVPDLKDDFPAAGFPAGPQTRPTTGPVGKSTTIPSAPVPVTAPVTAGPELTVETVRPAAATVAQAGATPEVEVSAPPVAAPASAVATPLAAIQAVLAPLFGGTIPGLPMESPLSWAALAVARRQGQPAPAAAVAGAAATVAGPATATAAPGTTTVIT
ncbi:MAG: hypothetical protein KDB47_09715, partial [Mycobacterium sp.]|nr:hypothetical protein [Mycobacterium sp.]